MNIMAYRMSVLLDSFHIVEKCNEYAKRVSHCRNQVMRSRMICLKTKEFIGNDTKDFLCQENHSIHNQYMELVNDIIAELKNN